ncbi:MAG: tetratricopeptide repeat protein [Bacteriovoracaceae bacterium]|nr:tetratricopeptide repeat protein [Bacteriovoracaceae bacterium]
MDVQSKYKELFSESRHDEAVDLLKKSEALFDPAIYHYNLGVNYAKLENLPMARLHLEKSINLGFKTPESQKSLEHVKEVLGVEALETKSSLKDYSLDLALDTSLVTGINITLLLIFILLLKIRKIKKNWIKLLCLAISLGPFLSQAYLKKEYTSVMSVEKLDVLRGPSSIFEQTQELPPGMKFTISSSEGDWVYVVVPQSHSGWIKNEGFTKL